MLTALTNDLGSRLALPDYRSISELESIRERARIGELICPICSQLLVLRAGQIRIPHFAHRRLNDCPYARVSEPILSARSIIYRYFQEKIQSAEIQGTVELEPAIDEMPTSTNLDVLLKATGFPPVAVVLLESNLKVDLRFELRRHLEEQFDFRPVFLASRLKQPTPSTYLLDTTQREYRQSSPFGATGDRESASTLRFIDPFNEQWLSLRSVRLFEKPQAHHAERHCSGISQMIWSQPHSEWIHPGESAALALHQQHLAEIKKARPHPDRFIGFAHIPKPEPTPEPLPKWLEGLVCIGCNVRTNSWQNAQPSADICVCADCFRRGIRLP